MSEQDVRDGLAALVVDEPPLAFDPDALMARADTATRRRRTLVGASSATLVIAAAAVALPIVLRGTGTPAGQVGPGGGQTVVTTPRDVLTTAADPAHFQWPPAHNHVPSYSVAQIEGVAHDLQRAADPAFRAAVPEAAVTEVQLFQGEAAGNYYAGQLTLNGVVRFKVAAGKAAVAIQVDAGATMPSPTSACRTDHDAKCDFKVLSDGSGLLVTNIRQGAALFQTVRHYRLDGVVVSATGYNYDGFGDERAVNLPKIPVTTTQLTLIATDPDLTM